MLKNLDLFSGMGGIRLAFEAEGFETVYSVDNDKHCGVVQMANGHKITVADVRDLIPSKLPPSDILTAGFPCQPFSIASRRGGFECEEYGDLFFCIVSLLKACKTPSFMLENVRHLVSHDKGKTIATMLYEMNQIGYEVEYKVLDTITHGGLPQHRERVFFVGFKKELGMMSRFEFPGPIPLKLSVSDLLEKEPVDKKYYYCDSEGVTSGTIAERIKDIAMKQGVIYQWRRNYLRENKSGVCFTLTANMGKGGGNVPLIEDSEGKRKLTPRECARLQGVPESYVLPPLPDGHIYRQIGDSVTVPLVSRIAKCIKKVLQ